MKFAVLNEDGTCWEHESDSIVEAVEAFQEIRKTKGCALIAVLAEDDGPVDWGDE